MRDGPPGTGRGGSESLVLPGNGPLRRVPAQVWCGALTTTAPRPLPSGGSPSGAGTGAARAVRAPAPETALVFVRLREVLAGLLR